MADFDDEAARPVHVRAVPSADQDGRVAALDEGRPGEPHPRRQPLADDLPQSLSITLAFEPV